jgi:hypothetical protein
LFDYLFQQKLIFLIDKWLLDLNVQHKKNSKSFDFSAIK